MGPIHIVGMSASKAIKLKHDSYLAERGGSAKLIDVICAKCNNKVLLYQKDGVGWLKRCYLNRIVGPEEYAELQNEGLRVETMPFLICQSCKSVIGTPILHKDGRLAFLMKRSTFIRKQNKTVRYR